MTPEQERVSERSDPSFNPAIALLRKTLSSGKDAEEGFLRWRADPYTRAFVAALTELADSPPVGSGGYETNRVLVQYGMSAGLGLAVKLLTQPSRVYPEIFRGDARDSGGSTLDASYIDTPDMVIDRM